MSTAGTVVRELEQLGRPEAAAKVQRFFKTGKGDYGEDDRFLGITMPVLRAAVKKFLPMPLPEIENLLHSHWHEARMAALLIMVRMHATSDAFTRDALFDLYLANTTHVNNWDLVDGSAPVMIGAHLEPGTHVLLTDLASSESVWERRIAIVGTYGFIKQGYLDETFRIATLLLNDRHDLIHKAVGWMLREAGKRDQAAEERFLEEHAAIMPRTMLRYAIERFPPDQRKRFMDMRIKR